MNNVTLTVEGHILTAKVDLSKECGSSKSGKSIVIGTTSGNKPIEGHDGVKIGLNVYKLNTPA